MFKKMLAATMLTVSLFGQSAWCMEAKTIQVESQLFIVSPEFKDAFYQTFIGQKIVQEEKTCYCSKIGNCLTEEITQITFLGPFNQSSFNGTGFVFDGLENAGPKLIINLHWSPDIDWDSLDIAIKAYELRYGYPPIIGK